MIRKKKYLQRVIPIVVATSLTCSNMTVFAVTKDDGKEEKSPFVITEILPDSTNVGESDGYEFIEITNTSDKELDFSKMKLVYEYPDSGDDDDVDWFKASTPLNVAAGASIVVWVKNADNQDLTYDDFNKFYNVNLEGDKNLFQIDCGGMANGSLRGLKIKTLYGGTISEIKYNENGVKNSAKDKSIKYSYDSNGTWTLEDKCIATPGVIDDGQINSRVEVPSSSNIKVTDLSDKELFDVSAYNSFKAEIDSNTLITNAVLYVKDDLSGDYEGINMTKEDDGSFTASVNGAGYRGKSSLSYYIEANDILSVKKTEIKTIEIKDSDNYEVSKTPFVITEVMPDTANVSGTSTDAYEFIEIYNISDAPINMKDYCMYYHYPDDGDEGDVQWSCSPDDAIVEPGKTLVFWIKNSDNQSLTIDDFNRNFGTALQQGKDLVTIDSNGMANKSYRGLKICTKTKNTLNKVLYNKDGAIDTSSTTSIDYVYNPNQDSSEILKTKVNPTPGEIKNEQIPAKKYHVNSTIEQPALRDNTASTFDSNEDFTFNLDISSKVQAKRVELYIKSNLDNSYIKYNLTGIDNFTKMIDKSDLIGKNSIDYYFEVSDGINDVKSDKKTIVNSNIDLSPVRINLKENEILNGTVPVISATDGDLDKINIKIDGEVIKSTEDSLESSPVIAFEATQTDIFFKNAVSMKKDDALLGVFDDGTYGNTKTISYSVPLNYCKKGDKVTVYIHSGTKASSFLHFNEENNDDFSVSNIRLILPDGTTLRGTAKGYDLNNDSMDVDISSNTSKWLSMGDSGGTYEMLECTFEIPEDKYNAKQYIFDTTAVSDGEHLIEASCEGNSKSLKVQVDNTAPEITTNIEEKQYKGEFTIEGNAVDNVSGLDKLSAQLDGNSIELPYKTSSVKLSDGTHVLKLKAVDKEGNKAEKTVEFTTPVENPSATSSVGVDGTLEEYPRLFVGTKDSTNDKLSVVFKKGSSYSTVDSNVKSYKGQSSVSGIADENGRVEMTPEEIKAASEKDEKEVSSISFEEFPYEMFEVTLSSEEMLAGKARFIWNGASSSGSRNYFYVYNTKTSSWEELTSQLTPDDGKITIDETIDLINHINSNNKVQFLVQNSAGFAGVDQTKDESSAADGNINDLSRDKYDYTFAWETDTQYYNADENNYKNQINIHDWILNNRDRMNIQYLFHTGDIVDNSEEEEQWLRADPQYKRLDNANFPYGVLAGNHDVGHKDEDYTGYYNYFGESRYNTNPWYGGSYKNNRGHYDLISVDGQDYLMMYMGWGIGDEEIAWMNEVLAKYPERTAILNFHEYLLQSNGLGEIPQRVYDEVVSKNHNVRMVLSGHYHQTTSRVDEFDDNKDGVNDRKVWQILFDYQSLAEGGLGYIRLMHISTESNELIMRTYSPSLDDYDSNGYSSFPVEKEEYAIPLQDLGISKKEKSISTDSFRIDIYTNEIIGEVSNVQAGEKAELEWKDAPKGKNGWYAEITDEFGGLFRTNVSYVNSIEIKNNIKPGESGGSINNQGESIKPLENAGEINQGTVKDVKDTKAILPQTGKNKLLDISVTAIAVLAGTLMILIGKNKRRINEVNRDKK